MGASAKAQTPVRAVIRVKSAVQNLVFSLVVVLSQEMWGDAKSGSFVSPSGTAAARRLKRSTTTALRVEMSWGMGQGGCLGGVVTWRRRGLARSHFFPGPSRGCIGSWSAEEAYCRLPPLHQQTGHSFLRIHFCNEISRTTVTLFYFFLLALFGF